MKRMIGGFAVGIILLSETPSWATMDGSIASLNRDEARLSMEMGSTSPCPLPPGEFSGIQQGNYKSSWLTSLCVYEEMDSFLHHEKVREYIRLMPPENVFAIYWEGRVDPRIFLGPALEGQQGEISGKLTLPEILQGARVFGSRPFGINFVSTTKDPFLPLM